MIAKLLIANRGEIACRIIGTCRRMGIATVAVYSDADIDALHVQMADQAIAIGPAPARESYLVVDRIIAAALESGADAIHPGYGFLSERPELAEACVLAGLIFVGPPATAIRAMGAKDAAKALMVKAGVPVVPGYHGYNQDEHYLLDQAEAIGWPILIKAVAGGGGKGMRRVDDPAAFLPALATARREATAAFGDDRVLIEKYLVCPRHIEVQVFADAAGRSVHLFERDCSIQRRHQKMIEEAPASGMSDDMRRTMGQAAVTAARSIGYVGAGTVEFIADVSQGLRADRFFFMEMNTRLQVEHPVTESITGQDLVEWQLRVAAGEPLPLAQDEIAINGHAVEARLYAEDPARNFMPSPGPLLRFSLPPGGDGLRIDSGVVEGTSVTPYYDPMMAKLIAHGPDRDTAIERLAAALDAVEVAGVQTNSAFLARTLRHPDFLSGRIDTAFLDTHAVDLCLAMPGPMIAAAAAVFTAGNSATATGTMTLRSGAKRLEIGIEPVDPGWRYACGEQHYHVTQADLCPDTAAVVIGGIRYAFRAITADGALWLIGGGFSARFVREESVA